MLKQIDLPSVGKEIGDVWALTNQMEESNVFAVVDCTGQGESCRLYITRIYQTLDAMLHRSEVIRKYIEGQGERHE